MEKDLIKLIESYPLATREQILSITLRNLHETAKRNAAVDWEEIEYYLQVTAKGFTHALPSNDQAETLDTERFGGETHNAGQNDQAHPTAAGEKV